MANYNRGYDNGDDNGNEDRNDNNNAAYGSESDGLIFDLIMKPTSRWVGLGNNYHSAASTMHYIYPFKDIP